MNPDAPLVLRVALDARWIDLPVRSDEDSGEWAAQAVDEALALRALDEPPPVRHLYTQTYAAVLDGLRARVGPGPSRLLSAYALVAETDLLPVVVAELAVHEVDEDLGLDAFADSLVVDPGQRFGEPDVGELATGLGPAVRLRQLRLVDEGEDSDRSVQTSLVHAWLSSRPGLAVTLSGWFGSPVDAETHGPVLDELAVSLHEGSPAPR